MSDATRRALQRVVRYVVIPALLVALDSIQGFLSAGTWEVNWSIVAVVTITALLAGLSKFIRDEAGIDAKVI